MNRPYRGRFAPTPSGPLHFGSLVTALAGWLDARYHGGQWLLRIDDLDPPRQQPGAVDAILRQLDTFELHWDSDTVYQSRRSERYQRAIDALVADGKAFYCTLSRKQLTALDHIHPGPAVAQPPGPDRAVRLAVPDTPLWLDDRLQGRIRANLAQEGGAFVIRRRDGLFGYQLACALDDAEMGITDVVRGSDLLASTLRQRWVLECLGQTAPCYAHLPVVMDPAGGKMSKSAGAAALDSRRPGDVLFTALGYVGLTPPTTLRGAGAADLLAWARAHWAPAHQPGGRRLPPPSI